MVVEMRAAKIAGATARKGAFSMDKNHNMCCYCEKKVLKSDFKYHCQSCGRFFCGDCIEELNSLDGALPTHSEDTVKVMELCKHCLKDSKSCENGRERSCKVYPSESPRDSPESPSPSFSGGGFDGHSRPPLTRSNDAAFPNHTSPASVPCSPSRSDEDEGEDLTSDFFGVPNDFFRDVSDLDSSIISSRDVFYSLMSVESSPSETTSSLGLYAQQEQDHTSGSQYNSPFVQGQIVVLQKPTERISETGNANNLKPFQHESKKLPKPLNFESSGLIWLPPPPEDVNDEMENNLFTYDDEDDEVRDSGGVHFSTANMDISVSTKYLDCKEPMRALVVGHFRALVSQLLQGQGVISVKDDTAGEWLEIITAIAWQAAKFIKPNTNRGGSMDPCDYLKVKCVASGSPRDSKLVKGVVCSKNIKHKRMMSQYKNARLLILGGALEYHKVPNQLASMEKLIQQENDQMKTIISKIEAHHPNVLLVEKTVSSIALEHLLAKEISLVLNVKRPLLDKIASCTGAIITPSTDHIPTAKLGHCELFHLEKVSEGHEPVNQVNKKPLKTLMFFEGCPRCLGCTVVLRGSTRAELKKVKYVVQYAVFAAYHLSLETSFLTDEGASLPNMEWKPSYLIPEATLCKTISMGPADSMLTTNNKGEVDAPCTDLGSEDFLLDLGLQDSLSELANTGHDYFPMPYELGYEKEYESSEENLNTPDDLRPTTTTNQNHCVKESLNQLKGQAGEVEVFSPVKGDGTEASSECYLGNDSHQSILVSFSSHSLMDGTVCERSRLLRVKFYGPSDKPLGRYLRDDLFGQSYLCKSCNEPAKAHVIRYTHQQEILTINVRHLPAVRLPGERDGKVWMWHRCLQCELVEGVPPATGRVVMSDAAWGLSFGKFLELSFSNHATGNRVATCGHSLQRDCLRFYGCGSIVASFQYSHIDTLSVCLPPSILEFNNPGEQSWIKKETYELLSKAKELYTEISSVLEGFKTKNLLGMGELSDASELQNYFLELNDMLVKEKYYYKDLEQEMRQQDQLASDIVEINHWRHSLLIASRSWSHRLYLLDSLLKRSSSLKGSNDVAGCVGEKDSDKSPKGHQNVMHVSSEAVPSSNEASDSPPTHEPKKQTEPVSQDVGNAVNNSTIVRHPSAASMLSDKIDFAWSGVDQIEISDQSLDDPSMGASENLMVVQTIQNENFSLRRMMGPESVYSFDSAPRARERIKKGLPPSLYLITLRSFHASGEYRYMVRDPETNMRRTYSHLSSREAEKPNLSSTVSPYLISSAFLLPEGARLMVLHNGQDDVALTVYDNEPTSIISYALFSKEHEDWIFNRPVGLPEGKSNAGLLSKLNSIPSELSSRQSFGSIDLDYMNYGNYRSEHHSGSHLHISFEDELSNTAGKVKFSVTCYFAKEFDALRRKCCPDEMDFIHSLSRCKKWSAQGGKSNVYFAKSFDERFIIKQVTKTELESFVEFAPGYFKYLTESLSTQSPTCLAKILGMYQVTVKYMKSGKEVKMDLMVMENLFFKRSISKIYDLKGSARSRYISDSSGSNKVLLDMNLLETLGRNPIFVGSKAKRNLERAIWNDTSFLASVDVMDYSLLVGVDEERKELVMGIIDFMRQYTWDKHLETWVKASGILGGPKNASPTIVSPKQYKKRFRKAMTSYFLAVPDQWSPP